MPNDALVTAGDVLAVTRHISRVGVTAGLSDLEQREPELAGLLIDQASDLHRKLGLLHVSYTAQRRLTHQVERLGLSLVLAIEAAHRRLWAIQADGTPLGDLIDPPSDDPPATP